MKKLFLLLSLLPTLLFAEHKPQIVFNKSAEVVEANPGEPFYITLEAYSEGKTVYMERAQKLDICLVVDNSSSMQNNKFSNGQTRWQVFKTAALSFCDSVSAQSIRNNVDHRMSIISFDASADIEVNWTSDIQSVHDHVNSMSTGSGTNQWMALAYAYEHFRSARSDAKRILVIMTDGEPYANDSPSSYRSTSRQTVMDNSLYYAQQIKDVGVEVYAMGIFSSPNSKVADCDLTCIQYMQYLSSCTEWSKDQHACGGSVYSTGKNGKYVCSVCGHQYNSRPSNGKCTQTVVEKVHKDVHPTEPANEKHYFTASDASTLNNIFTTILEKTTITALNPGKGYTVTDIVNPEAFQLPAGTSASDILVYTSAPIGLNGYSMSGWSDPEPFAADIVLNGNTVTIGNFDFGNHFVGPACTDPLKLIIKVPVEAKDLDLDEDQLFRTNSEGSCIYDENRTPVANFPFPEVKLFASDMYLTLQSWGLGTLNDLVTIVIDGTTFNQIITDDNLYKFKCKRSSSVDITPHDLAAPEATYSSMSATPGTGKCVTNYKLYYTLGTETSIQAVVNNILTK